MSSNSFLFACRCLEPPSGTGEHGVGLGKKMYLTEELGAGTIALMKTIKAALDPLNLLNPGKVCEGSFACLQGTTDLDQALSR